MVGYCVLYVAAEEPPVHELTGVHCELHEDSFERDYRIYAGTSVVFAIKMFHLFADEFKIKYSTDFSAKCDLAELTAQGRRIQTLVV